MAENDGSIEVCVTPNRTIFCSERSAIILMITTYINSDVRISGTERILIRTKTTPRYFYTINECSQLCVVSYVVSVIVLFPTMF